MSQILEAQNLVLDALQSEDGSQTLVAAFDSCLRTSNTAVLTALAQARSDLEEESIFRAALLYYRNDFAWETRAAREQKEEALRLLLLYFDFTSGEASKKDLDGYLHFLETRMEIRFFAQDPRRAIAYIESIYGEKADQFLASITHSQPATIKRWRSGANHPTKSSKQTLASAAEVLYQLHSIKGWDEARSIDWFTKHAFAALTQSSYFAIFSPALERKLKDLDLVPVGIDLWL